MRSYLRIHSPWSQFAVLLLLCGIGYYVAIYIAIGILQSHGVSIASFRDLNLNDPNMVGILKTVQSLYSIIVFFVTAVVFAFSTYQYNTFFFLGFRKQENIIFYFIAIGIVFFSFPFFEWLGELNQHIPLANWMIDSEKDASRQMQAFLKVNHKSDIIINILLIGLLPAICEEVFFRGCMQRILIYLFRSPWAGIIVTASLFSAFHMEFAGFLPRMFLGILLGALFWYSNSLWPNIIAHFLFNAVQVIAVTYNPKMIDENPTVPIYGALISGAIILALLFLMRTRSSVTFAKIYDIDKLDRNNDFIS